MSPLHQCGARPKLEQGLALARHVRLSSGERLAEQRGGFGEVGGQAVYDWKQLPTDRFDKARLAQRLPG